MKNIIWVFRTFGFGAGILYTVDVITRVFRKPWNRRAEDRVRKEVAKQKMLLQAEAIALEDHEVEEIQVHYHNTLN